jgi:hypothetical protein
VARVECLWTLYTLAVESSSNAAKLYAMQRLQSIQHTECPGGQACASCGMQQWVGGWMGGQVCRQAGVSLEASVQAGGWQAGVKECGAGRCAGRCAVRCPGRQKVSQLYMQAEMPEASWAGRWEGGHAVTKQK